MPLLIMGLNHKTAPLTLRERLASAVDQDADTPHALHALHALPGVQAGLLLSTCNRFEVYVVVDPYHLGHESILTRLAQWADLPPDQLEPHLYSYHEHEVARHLFRVTCGLESMVMGEAEILGQVRRAYKTASAAGCVDTILHRLFQSALKVGKQVRSETDIGRQPESVGSAAVRLARNVFPDLARRVVMVLGAGENAEILLRHLRANGVADVVVLNRTVARAQALARQHGGRAAALADLPAHLPAADIVICSTGAAGWVLDRQLLADTLRVRPQGDDLLVIDLAVPRDVEPGAAALPGLDLFSIDDLLEVSLQDTQAVPQVEAMIQDEVEKFTRWSRGLNVIPLICSLREKAQHIQDQELERIFKTLPHLDEHERHVIELAITTLINKILNTPTMILRERAGQEEGELYARAVSDLFELAVPRDG